MLKINHKTRVEDPNLLGLSSTTLNYQRKRIWVWLFVHYKCLSPIFSRLTQFKLCSCLCSNRMFRSVHNVSLDNFLERL